MNKRNLIWLLFVPVVLLQLYVPASMILDREQILDAGKAFKFKTEPIDPEDPFRGRYINLTFDANTYPTKEVWKYGEVIYVLISEGDKGFVKIDSVSRNVPSNDHDYVKAKVWYESEGKVMIDYPFDKFYMDEFKAPRAESVYREAVTDTLQVAYANVFVKEGEAVIADVLINGKSVKELE